MLNSLMSAYENYFQWYAHIMNVVLRCELPFHTPHFCNRFTLHKFLFYFSNSYVFIFIFQPPSRGHGAPHGSGGGQWKLSNLMKPNNLLADAQSQAGSQASSAPSSQFNSPAKRQGINLLDEVVRTVLALGNPIAYNRGNGIPLVRRRFPAIY